MKRYTKKELRLLYGVPESTFLRWLKPLREQLNLDRKNWLSEIQVERIVKEFGIPGLKVFYATQ